MILDVILFSVLAIAIFAYAITLFAYIVAHLDIICMCLLAAILCVLFGPFVWITDILEARTLKKQNQPIEAFLAKYEQKEGVVNYTKRDYFADPNPSEIMVCYYFADSTENVVKIPYTI